jgi:hypothetical protein
MVLIDISVETGTTKDDVAPCASGKKKTLAETVIKLTLGGNVP